MLSQLAVTILLAAPIAHLSPTRVALPAAAPELGLRQVVGQRMVFAYDGLRPPAALRRRIARGEAAGVIVFSRNVRSAAQLRATIRGLQAIRRPRGLRAPLLVMVDQEGGPVRRIPGSPRRAPAAVRTTAQARADGRAAARTLRSAGVNMNLAPVADVAAPGSALERERRTYGRSTARVASLSSAFARGLRAGRVLATAKHYPGFGAARVNTDDAPARIPMALSRLRAQGAPFARLSREGIEAIMLSTAVYPALDEIPAAFSPAWIGRELRGRVGFEGVTISDDLGTPAVADWGSLGERAVLAARAGVDLPLFSSSYAAGARAAEGLVAAARSGEIDERGLRAGARRVMRLRAAIAR